MMTKFHVADTNTSAGEGSYSSDVRFFFLLDVLGPNKNRRILLNSPVALARIAFVCWHHQVGRTEREVDFSFVIVQLVSIQI